MVIANISRTTDASPAELPAPHTKPAFESVMLCSSAAIPKELNGFVQNPAAASFNNTSGFSLFQQSFPSLSNLTLNSASYKQGELKAGDLILKVAQGAGEPVDIVDMKLDDAIQLIRGKKGTEVRLTVKKPDGSIHVIPIIRETVVIEESYARSAIFTYKKKKFGVKVYGIN
jgi:hypothetical protein